MQRLEGDLAPIRTAADRKKLVGKYIRYLRDCDIDKSGRGYFFPRFDGVLQASGRLLHLTNGDSLKAGDLREVVVVRDIEEDDYI